MTRETDTRHVWPRLTKQQADALIAAAREVLAGDRPLGRDGATLDRAVGELVQARATWEYHNGRGE